MNRILQPELLDRLASHEPTARHSRRDLRWVNAAMGNPRWLRGTLGQLAAPRDRLLELGAGDGAFARTLPGGCDALDLQPPPADWPAESEWHQVDVRIFAQWADYPVVFANLFFHHLSNRALAVLGQQLRRHTKV